MSRDEEAANWFAVMRRGVISLEHRAAYAAWLAQDENRQAMEKLQTLWSLMDRTPRPVALPRHTRKVILSAICACSLVVGTLSAMTGTPFWTKLDWTDR